MAQGKLAVRTVIVTFDNGIRVERDWDTIPEEERQIISRNLADRLIEATGYILAEKYYEQPAQARVNHDGPKEEESITFNAQKAAAYLNIHYETLLKMARRKQIPHHRIGRKLLFQKESLDQWIEDQEQRE